MFLTSTQLKHWIFKDEDELSTKRLEVNEKFRCQFADGPAQHNLTADAYFLTPAEEHELIRQHTAMLLEFCRRFEPMMPKCVYGTSMQLFKRFYMRNSPMDYHPKEMLFTIAFLACKIEEFNVSLDQFVANISGGGTKMGDMILFNEMLAISLLNFQLIVHNPYRPVEGFLIDIKTRSDMHNPDRLRPYIDAFLDSVLLTDACLLYAPSQIALAAVLHAASKEKENLDRYVMENLFRNVPDQKYIANIVTTVRKIRLMVNNYVTPNAELLQQIEQKLAICRNPTFNPESEVCRERMREIYHNQDQTHMPLAIANAVVDTKS